MPNFGSGPLNFLFLIFLLQGDNYEFGVIDGKWTILMGPTDERLVSNLWAFSLTATICRQVRNFLWLGNCELALILFGSLPISCGSHITRYWRFDRGVAEGERISILAI